MDDKKMLQAMRKLKWEADYWKRAKGEDTGNVFLTEIDHLDHDFIRALHDRGIKNGKLLDIGTGLGRQAIELADLGFEVTATDISRIGITEAARNASSAGAQIRFFEDDITHTSLTETFDVVLDRGCFAVLQEELLDDYAASVAGLVRPNGIFLLKIDRKKASRIDHLSGRFTVMETYNSFYLLKDKPIKAAFFVLQTTKQERW